MDSILLLGNSGMMGTAITQTFKDDYNIIGMNTSNLNAESLDNVKEIIKVTKPNILINCIAKMGVDCCEEDINGAIKLNFLLPRLLAELSIECNYILINFSTSSVFDGKEKILKTENDYVYPVHIYGITKYAGDSIIKNIAKRYYIFRIPILFGPTNGRTQLIENLRIKVMNKQEVYLADDVSFSPTYNIDVSKRMKEIIEKKLEYGVYHIANSGIGSLYDIIIEMMANLNYRSKYIKKGSYLNYSSKYRRDVHSIIKSVKLEEMRYWKDAMREYCNELKTI